MNAHPSFSLKYLLRPCRGLALLWLLVGNMPAAAVTLAVCEAGDAAPAQGQDYYLEADKRVQLWQGEGQAPAGCSSVELPLTMAALRWVGLVAQDAAAPQQLSLQGSFAQNVRVSEIELGLAAAAGALPLPMGVDLLPHFLIQTFGTEERVSISQAGAVSCAAGLQPAGIVLAARATWSATPAQELELQLQGAGAIQLALADASRARAQAPLVLGTLPLVAGEGLRQFRYRLPQQGEDWLSVTLACPQQQASFTLAALRLLPQELPLPRQRSAWFWAPALWQEQSERLLALAQAWQLERLFLSLPLQAGVVQQSQQLQDFIAAAHALGLQIWPVLGDPRHVLPAERAALAEQVQGYLDYNATAPEQARLDGLQLDIEPHLLPGFALAQPQWRQAWLDTVHAVQQQLGEALPLDLVVPVWWGTHPAWSAALLDELRGPQLSLTVMNYRTATSALRAGAQPFLEWGQRQQVPVSMALEAGSIGPDEQRLHYRQADSGELLWLALDEHRLLVLLDAPQHVADSVAYRVQGESPAAVRNITFAGDLLQLEATAAELEPEWRSWSVYAGLAIHGLDEVLLPAAATSPAGDP